MVPGAEILIFDESRVFNFFGIKKIFWSQTLNKQTNVTLVYFCCLLIYNVYEFSKEIVAGNLIECIIIYDTLIK